MLIQRNSELRIDEKTGWGRAMPYVFGSRARREPGDRRRRTLWLTVWVIETMSAWLAPSAHSVQLLYTCLDCECERKERRVISWSKAARHAKELVVVQSAEGEFQCGLSQTGSVPVKPVIQALVTSLQVRGMPPVARLHQTPPSSSLVTITTSTTVHFSIISGLITLRRRHM